MIGRIIPSSLGNIFER